MTIDSRSGAGVLDPRPGSGCTRTVSFMTRLSGTCSCPTNGGAEAVFDAAGRRVATVQLGGGAGNVQYDSVSGKILVDV